MTCSSTAGRAASMRGPGNTPGAFALEQAVDELAEKLGLDPLALREKIDASPVRREERRIGAERIGWSARHAPGADPGPGEARPRRRAIVLGREHQHGGLLRSAPHRRRQGGGPFRRAGHRHRRPARRSRKSSPRRSGSGPKTSSCASATPTFPPGRRRYGSRTTASMTPPARTAAWRVLQAMLAAAGLALDVAPSDLDCERRAHLCTIGDAERALALRRRRRRACRADADHVDRLAQRRLRRLSPPDGRGGARAAGSRRRAIRRSRGRHRNRDRPGRARRRGAGLRAADQPAAAREPGAGRRADGPRPTRSTRTASSTQPRAAWSTPISSNTSSPARARRRGSRSSLLENYQGRSATDAYGIAEPANIATAPAIANAVYNAIGVRLRALPMTPAAVLAALGKIAGVEVMR